MNKTILGLDIGDSTIGVAASDPSGTICVPVGVIKRKSKVEDMAELQKIIEERNVGTIV
ncbi:MAG: RuvX/YqgF family protein, partial [Ezakiella massiliensis]